MSYFFLTFSANDLQWPELFCCLDTSLSKEDVQKLSKDTKWKMMTIDPVMCAVHFHRRTFALMQYVFSSESPLGCVSDYWVRVEFQMRGSPHLHMFLWIENAPDLSTPEGFVQAPDFIDKNISTQLPDNNKPHLRDLVCRLQTHKHTSSCQKGRSNSCRFHFPRAVCNTTKLVSSLSPSSGHRFYETKRKESDIWVNAYNPTLLSLWEANMDIQLVGSKYGAAYYVCMYVSKSEPQGLKEVLSKIVADIPPNSSVQKRLAKIGNTVLSHRLLSSQEAVYRLCSLPLVKSSRQTVWINSKIPSKRSRLLRPKKEIESLSSSSTNVFVPNIVDAYSHRPSKDLHAQHNWENMSLATFVTSFFLSSKSAPRDSTPSFYIEHINKLIVQRSKSACLRAPKFSPMDGEEYFFHMLFLFVPWRSDSDIKGEFQTYEAAFVAKKHFVDCSTLKKSDFAEQVENAIKTRPPLNHW